MGKKSHQILLLGGSGQLGQYFQKGLSRFGDVFVSSRRREHSRQIFYDASEDSISLQLSDWAIVVYAAGLTSMSECEKNPALSRLVNFQSPVRVGREVSGRGGYFVFISSSAANEYQDMSRDQAQEFHSLGGFGASIYGLHKYLAEQELAEIENTLSLRLSKVALPDWALLRDWVTKLKNIEPIEAFSDYCVSPIGTEIVTLLIEAALRNRVSGMVEASASDQCSYLAVAQMFARELGIDESAVSSISATSKLEARHIPKRSSLDSHRAEALLGSQMPPSLEVLKRYVR